MRRVSASKLQETNPKCQITTDISGADTEPTVDVEFGEFIVQNLVYHSCGLVPSKEIERRGLDNTYRVQVVVECMTFADFWRVFIVLLLY